MEKDVVPPIALARLKRAWDCIVKTYLPKVKNDALEKGEGLAMFRFLRPRESTTFNCHYFFAQRGSDAWNEVVNASPLRGEIVKKYIPGRLLISVTVPVHEIGEEELSTVKMFDEGLGEVEL